MTTSIENFFRLSREIREMIYDLVLEPIEFSNLYTAKTAYTPESCPLLYVHRKITEDLQHRLYKNHAIVIPFQDAGEYIRNDGTFAQYINKPTRRMKMQTDKIIVEVVQSKRRVFPQNPHDRNGTMNHMRYVMHWQDLQGGNVFPPKVVPELLQMKNHLTAVKTIKFVLWQGEWHMSIMSWRDPLQSLLDNWDGLRIELEMNVFDYQEPPRQQGFPNIIQAYHRHCAPIERISFSANDFHWEDHESGNYWGHRIDPTGFASQRWRETDPRLRHTLETPEARSPVYMGEVERRPLLVKPHVDKDEEGVISSFTFLR
ncbi:hypothetical protein CEP52_013956 [Fusarium oligoseptatum]|uniref:Uncharacterized protein n=2 Tax=Fusarium solani species complex TaxID=232080 RepID=A0A428SR13_9HYPO|nr:hypothetical protein CEP51_001667 [Fusarium floridanum]RSL92208.1 hypothetical protein CEP52_013956 [Fusarium oligoseptatum]